MDADTYVCGSARVRQDRSVHADEWLETAARRLFSHRVHHWIGKSEGRLYRIAETWMHGSAASSVASESEEAIEERFTRLAAKWSHDTAHISSVTDLINDTSYQQIIDMGEVVLPYLLRDLDQNKRFWFPALAAITGLRPFDPKDQGNYRMMTEAWLRWGKRKGLVRSV